jgi:hypothetical protein
MMSITIKVLGEFDNVETHIVATGASKEALKRQLGQAIASLEAEMCDLDKCPYHRAQGAST